MNSSELRRKFLDFFEKHGHTIVPSSSLLPSDPSVLFTTAGMQQFKPYYLGEKSPYGNNVVSCQKCIRTSDIEEVGDERHLTFFEMLGNFSFGGYFKEKAIELAYKFIVEELKLEIDYVTIFSPDKVANNDWRKGVAEDKESFEIWKKVGVPESKIRKEGVDNFWGPTGDEGPCGPTTEIYVNGIEIWNIVFNEFFCDRDKKLEKLETPGVDTGMGLERLAMVTQKKETVFETDLFEPIIKLIPNTFDIKKKRIIADHARAIAFLISDGVRPSNKKQEYVLRRLIRRIMTYEFLGKRGIFSTDILIKVVDKYNEFYKELKEKVILDEFYKEREASQRAIDFSVSILDLMSWNTPEKLGKKLANLHEQEGADFDLAIEILGKKVTEKERNEARKVFDERFKKHQELSRTASAGMFKGGLADRLPETIKLHTAHHLLLAALQELFGKQVKQKGSNINSERLRIDFSFDRKLTDEEKRNIENMVNEKISQRLEVVKREMPKEEAEKIGAEMEFGVKYGNTVSVYFIEDKKGKVFSKEFCGGPHVKNTSELGTFKIIKEESSSTGVRRIKAILE